jgi:hypothetical protein
MQTFVARSKIGALDQAAPLVGWDLSEEFATLRRLIEARMAKRGKTRVRRGAVQPHRDQMIRRGTRRSTTRRATDFRRSECGMP